MGWNTKKSQTLTGAARQCFSKECLQEWEAAGKAKRITAQNRKKGVVREAGFYHCDVCGMWHVCSKKATKDTRPERYAVGQVWEWKGDKRHIVKVHDGTHIVFRKYRSQRVPTWMAMVAWKAWADRAKFIEVDMSNVVIEFGPAPAPAEAMKPAIVTPPPSERTT